MNVKMWAFEYRLCALECERFSNECASLSECDDGLLARKGILHSRCRSGARGRREELGRESLRGVYEMVIAGRGKEEGCMKT